MIKTMDPLKPSMIKFCLKDYFNISTAEMKRNLEIKSHKITEKWVKSNYTDFSIYHSDDYIFDCVLCFIDWTKQAIKTVKRILPDLRSILDFYNGVGLSTIQIKNLWPDAQVSFFNDVENQMRFYEYFRKRTFQNQTIFKMRSGQYDAVFIFEVFEHYANPEKFFVDIIHPLIGKYLVFTATFGQMDPGHFPEYNGIDGKRYGHHFAKFIEKKGYKKIFTGWNSRPVIYEYIN